MTAINPGPSQGGSLPPSRDAMFRREALERAAQTCGLASASQVVASAKLYYEFLTGTEKSGSGS